MAKFTNEAFEKIIQNITDKFLEKFIPGYNDHAVKGDYVNDELIEVENMITAHYYSSDKLNSDYHKIIKLKDKKIGRTYAETIELYCQETKENPKKIFEFSAKVKALDQLKNKLVNEYGGRMNRYIAFSENPQKSISQTNAARNKTIRLPIARKIIMLNVLIEAASKNGDLVKFQDKTEIARFIDVLISETPFVGNIRDDNTYKKTKQLYGKLSEASIEDLKFAETEFEKIGFSSIVNEIKKAIETNSKQKNK